MEGNEVEEKIVGDLDWDGLHRPRIYYAVATTFCGLFLSVLDGSICNVALPSIARELGVSSSDSIWIVNAFQLVIMMTILPFASMGERWGYKQVYLRGVIVFTIGSLFCALSHNLSLLVISRVFQGFGAAMIMSVNTSLIKLIYPKRRLGEGVGLNATVVAIASVAGPTLAAGILSVASWPWLFAINVPVGVVTFFMWRRYLPDNAVRVLGGIVSFVIIGTFYVRMQLRERYPMLPFDLLKIPIFSMSVVTSILSFTAQMLSLVAMPFLLATTFHYDAVGTGLLMTSWPLVIVFVAPLAGLMIGKVHPGILGGVGLTIMSVGCFCLSFIPTETGHFGLVWRLMLCGMGFGLFQSPNNHMLLSSAPPQRTGSASGMLATARLIGQTVGAALVALLFHLYGDSAPHDAMLLAGILTLCGAFSSCCRLKVSMPK